MNGRYSSLTTPSLASGPLQSAGRRPPVSTRLAVSLAVSCLLHAAVVLLPYAGESRIASRSALKGGQQFHRAFSASITSTHRTPFTVPPEVSGSATGPEVPTPKPTTAADTRTASEQSAGANLLPIPAPHYYTTDQLTKRPQPIAAADLDQPETRAIVASGKIVLKLWVDDHGEVVDVLVEQSELPEAISGSAVAAFRKLRFVPGELNGRRVGSVMRIEITYDDGRKQPS